MRASYPSFWLADKMKIHPKFTVGWLLFTVPFLTTLSLEITPSRAATFASATTSVNLLNFSQNAESSSVTVDATALATSPQGSILDSDSLDSILENDQFISVEAVDNTIAATADFSTVASFPSTTSGSSFVSSETNNEALGIGENYSGDSQTESTVLANFFLNPEAGEAETLSFDFSTFWELETLATNPDQEMTTASANISLMVCGRTALNKNPLFCDSFSTAGQIQSLTPESTFSFSRDNGFSLDVLVEPEATFDPSLNLTQANFFAMGSYQREFETPIYLTVAEVQTSEVTAQTTGTPVKTPEPSVAIALLSLGTLTIGFSQRKTETSH